MVSKILKSASAVGVAIVALSVTSSYARDLNDLLLDEMKRMQSRGGYSIPAQPLAVPPGMVPMIVYVPAQQIQSQPMAAPVAPHTHAPTPPQAARTIEGTHCSINDVDVLTQDPPSCEKAGGKVVAEKASFPI